MNDATQDGPAIEDYYREDRTFSPAPEFVAQAVINDPSIYSRADADPEGFWAEQARELITWDTDFHTPPEKSRRSACGKLYRGTSGLCALSACG